MNSEVDYLKNLKLHHELNITTDGKIQIHRSDARKDECSYKEIDLHRFMLPTNSIYQYPQKLLHQPHLLSSALHAISEFSSSSPESKSKAPRIAYMLSNITKFLEYLWLNDVYQLSDIPKHLISDLPKILAMGGWHSALKIKDRLSTFLESADDIKHPIFSSSNWKASVSNIGLQIAIGTNISGKETANYFNQIQNFRKEKDWLFVIPSTEPIVTGLKFSNLRQTLESLNYIYIKPENAEIPSQLFPNHVKTSSRLTDSPGRTKNIDGHGAGKLLEKALHYIYDRSESLLSFFDAATNVLCSGLTYEQKIRSLRSLTKSHELNDLIDPDLKSQRPIKILDINNLIRDLLTACFLCIAVFNARRRDEISHPKLGLYLGCCTTYNADMRIYELNIYIEKNRKDYVPFYVGDATQRAVEILEKFQLIQSRLSYKDHVCGNLHNRETTLFRYRLLTVGGLAESYSNYNFECYDTGQAQHFFTSLGVTIYATSHMFRRLYCTIFMNQHEFPHLPALSYQLQHDNLDTTRIYITSPISQNEAALLSRVYDWSIADYQQTHEEHNEKIAVEMAAAAREKLSEIIYSIFSGDPSSGGYGRLILKLYKRLHRTVHFEGLDDAARINSFISKLATRGHAPTPFRHGQCMSLNVKLKSASKCFSKKDNQLHKENASPNLCKSCPYSWSTQEHIQSLEVALQQKTDETNSLNSQSIMGVMLDSEIHEIRDALAYHLKNMGLDK